MSYNKLPPKKSEVTNELARKIAGSDMYAELAAALKAVRLPKSTISEALRDVLESRNRITELLKSAQNLPTVQLKKTIASILGHSRETQDALKSIPSVKIKKTIRNLKNASTLNVHSLSLRTKVSKLQISTENRSDTKLLTDVADLGAAIRRGRKAKGLTQQNFADLAGVGRRFLSELEQGKQTLEVGKVFKVAAAAGIELTFTPDDAN